jgi:adenine-specific DNA-methyltransferase
MRDASRCVPFVFWHLGSPQETPADIGLIRTRANLVPSRYDHLNREELLRLLESRDRRDATKLGLVWEANEIERDHALNNDFVALDLDVGLSVPAAPPGGWRNLIIEGDNFDALRYLRMTHAGQVKCILIDPPYNTGKKDFVYNDRFVDENHSWRFSLWLEFLYQRLIIARDLLREDGVLLCCINDENRAKLELLLDKIFPGKRLGSFVWRTKDSANDAGGNLSQVHEHVLVYANRSFAFAGKPIAFDDYRNPDNDPRGDWTPQPLTCPKSYRERANLYYPVQDPATGYWYPCDPDVVWSYSTEVRVKPGQTLRADTMETMIRSGRVYFPSCKPSEVLNFKTREELLTAIRAGKGPILPKKKKPLLREDLPDLDFWIGKPIAPGRPSRKDFLKNKQKMVAPVSSWIAGEKEKVDHIYEDQGEAELLRSARGGEGSDALVEILGQKAFDYPKPPSLIRALVKQATGPDDLVVDFFGGSGTTAQAVIEVNHADGEKGRRRFILVSNTEATEEVPDKNICRDVCARRVGNVISGYGNAPGLGGDFAYLRTRRIATGQLLDIDHAQVWTALLLLHDLPLTAYNAAEAFAWAGGNAEAICYLPRFAREQTPELRRMARAAETVVLYSWQPDFVRHHIRATQISHQPIPEVLARRFGLFMSSPATAPRPVATPS